MLSTHEKVFIRNWQIQKEGPKWRYYLQYIIAWTVIIFLSLFFLVKLIMEERDMGGWTSFFIILPSSILLAALITHLVYKMNERKLNKLLEREKEQTAFNN